MTNFNRIAILAASAAIVSTPALASPAINFSIQTNQFSKPTMEFKYQGGKYVWDAKPINTQFVASANTGSNKLHWLGSLFFDSMGTGPSTSFTGKVPADVPSWTQQGAVTFPVSFLTSYQANFAAYCEGSGTTKPVVNQSLSIMFNVWQVFHEKSSASPPQVSENTSPSANQYAQRVVNMPVTVACGPKPMPRPGGIAAEKGSFKVQSIDLSFGGAPTTKPNPATVCKQAKLAVTVKANQAGAVKFKLWTKVGTAPMQSKVIDAWAAHDGKGFFVASYHENVSVNRTTGVQAMAEEMINAIELSTPWKNVTLHCTGAGGGGLAGTPNTSNPDNQPLPSAPVKPKRVFDGPNGLTPGAQPTHAPVRPVIAPVRVKTAPVAPKRTPAAKKTAPPNTAAELLKPLGRSTPQ